MHALSMAELGILDWIAAHCHNGFLDGFMPFVSSLGNGGMIWITLGLGILLLHRGQRSTGLQVLLALLLSLLLCNLLLKNGVDRIRPCQLNEAAALLIPCPQDPSFPSGHTSASFAAVVVLFLRRWRGRWAALVLAVLIAFSRLYLYVHFPTDVLGGIVVGSLCGWLAVKGFQRWIAPHWPERRGRAQPPEAQQPE